MKKRKGVSLIVLIITIIVVIILAAAVILALSKDGGIINKARYAKDEYNKIEYRDRINEAYTIVKNKQEMQGKPDREIFEEVKKSLNFEKAKYEICDKSMNITTKEGYEYTILGDGYIYDEKVVVLDIAEGNIDLYSNGYKQYTGALQGLNQNGATSFTGKYIITGTTTENVVRVCDEGKYDITIKDLKIDVGSSGDYANSSFNANAGSKAQNCYVNIALDGNNVLYSKGMAGIQFCGGNKNNVVETNRSTLTISGDGALDTECKSGYDGAGIGGNYNSVPVCDIVINSGNIKAIGKSSGCGIGGGLRQPLGNITINGGKIIANGGYASGIGGDSVVINGGELEFHGGEYGNAIISSKKLEINCGKIIAGTWSAYDAILSPNIEILGGTFNIQSLKKSGIVCKDGGNIKISGGNILVNAKENNISTYNNSTSVPYTPTNGTDEIYLTQIKLPNDTANQKIESITTSDNLQYGVKDMYTLEDGMLYLYLPIGTREITIKVNGKVYAEEVETSQAGNCTIFSE